MLNDFRDLPIRTKILATGAIAAMCILAMVIVGWRVRAAIGEAVTTAYATIAAMDALGEARAEIRLVPTHARDLQIANTLPTIARSHDTIRIHVERTMALLDAARSHARSTPDVPLIDHARQVVESVGVAASRSAAARSNIISLRDSRLTSLGDAIERRLHDQTQRARAVSETGSAALPTQLEEIHTTFNALRLATSNFLVSRDVDSLTAARNASATIVQLLVVAERLADDADTHADLAIIATEIRVFIVLMERMAILTDTLVEIDEGDLTPAQLDAEAAITAAYRRYASTYAAAIDGLTSTAEATRNELALIAASVLVAMILTGFVVHRMMTQPVLSIARAMRDISTGRHETALPYMERGDEIGDLARAAGTFRAALMEIAASRLRLGQAITRQRAADAELRRLALVVKQTANSVVIADRTGKVEWVNDAFVKLTGYTAEELVGRRPGPILQGPETSQETVATMRAALAEGRGFDVEVLNYRKDGTPYWVEIRTTPVLDATGAVVQFIAIEDDRTQRRLDQQRLEQALATERDAHEQRKRFVTIASHEFRTPLAIIDGAAQRLLQAPADIARDKINARAERIRTAVGRMIQLIDRMLYSARLEHGRIKAELVPIDVMPILGAAIRRQAEIAKHVTITQNAALPAIAIRGDAQLLEQVFQNLLSNAVKYSGRSTRIEVDTRIEGDHVAIAVTDHGVGIPPDELPRMFQRFFRASTAQGIAGTGIGLNFVKDLVEMHGGSIDVVSALGKGSTFTVRMPLAVAQSGDTTSRSAA